METACRVRRTESSKSAGRAPEQRSCQACREEAEGVIAMPALALTLPADLSGVSRQHAAAALVARAPRKLSESCCSQLHRIVRGGYVA
jgi:hypothetical protein